MQKQKITVRPGEIKIIRFLPGGISQDAITIPQQGIMVLVADNGIVLVECTVDGNYIRIFKTAKKLKRYIKEMHDLDIEIE